MFAGRRSSLPEMRDPTRTSAPIFGLIAPMARAEEEKSRGAASAVDGAAASATLGEGRFHQSAPPTASIAAKENTMRRLRVRLVNLLPRSLNEEATSCSQPLGHWLQTG